MRLPNTRARSGDGDFAGPVLRTIALTLCICHCGSAAPATQPSDQAPIGWRGDGTGKYPNTSPVLNWSRRVKTPLTTLRSQAARPRPNDPAGGEPLLRARGAFEPVQWLVLGPFPVEKPELAVEQNVGVNEADAAPAEGEQVGTAAWRSVRIAERGVDFAKLIGRLDHPAAAYICAYIYCPQPVEAGIGIHGDHGKHKCWINGKPANTWELAGHPLVKGWNRMLAKVELWPRAESSNISVRLTVLPGPDVEYESQNIVWATHMPGPGYGMPIIVGDRLYSPAEPNEVVCIDKQTGRVIWMRSDALWYAASKIEPPGGPLDAIAPKVAQLDAMEARYVASANDLPRDRNEFDARRNADDDRRRLAQDLTDSVKKLNSKYGVELGWGGGNCGPTPCSDGSHIYFWHGETGVLSCFTPDGTRVYTRFHHSGQGDEHGVNSSPLLCGDRIVVIGGRQWLCFDKGTGNLLWSQKYRHCSYGTAVLARVGGEDVAIAPDGQIIRIADGSVIQKAFGPYDGEIASVVREANHFYLIARGGFCEAELPESFANGALAPITFAIAPNDLRDAETYPVGSPVVYGGLVYATHSGWTDRHPMLLVVDPAKKAVVYRQELPVTPEIHYGPDGAGVAASVALAGGKLFIMDNRGTCVVAEPGPQWKQLASNTIEQISRYGRQEITQSTPIFDGDRIYYRAEENLYCIGR